MSRFNTYINTHFSSCRVIARAFDDCRGREVTLHQIPGHWDAVGVTDGTDAWVAPAAAAPFFRTATGNVAEILRRLQAGEPLPEIPDAPPRKRQRVRLDDPPASSQPAATPQPTATERRPRVRI